MAQQFFASPPVAEFLLSTARFKGLIGGIGSGKTAGGAANAVIKINEGKDGIIVSPDFPHFSKSTWPEFRKWAPWSKCLNRHLNHPFTQDKRLLFQTPHGIVTVYYGGIDDPDAWTGPTVNWFWFDEGRRKNTRAAFDVLCGRIRAGDSPQGFVTTSPKGKRHWLYNVFELEDFPDEIREIFAKYGQKVVEYWHVRTEDNAANLDPLYHASLKAIYTGVYALQELEGQFIIFEGAVWDNWIDDFNITSDADFVPGIPVEWAVDDGYTKNHPRVFLLSQTVPPHINFFAEYVSTYELQEQSITAVLGLCQEHGWDRPDVAYVDSNAAELKRRIWDEEIDTVGATHRLEEGIKHARPFIRDGNRVSHVRFHPRCMFAKTEIPSWSYPEGRRQRSRPGSGQEQPERLHDNASDAMRYLLWFKKLEELAEIDPQAAAHLAANVPARDARRRQRVPAGAQNARTTRESARTDSDVGTGSRNPRDFRRSPNNVLARNNRRRSTRVLVRR